MPSRNNEETCFCLGLVFFVITETVYIFIYLPREAELIPLLPMSIKYLHRVVVSEWNQKHKMCYIYWERNIWKEEEEEARGRWQPCVSSVSMDSPCNSHVIPEGLLPFIQQAGAWPAFFRDGKNTLESKHTTSYQRYCSDWMIVLLCDSLVDTTVTLHVSKSTVVGLQQLTI